MAARDVPVSQQEKDMVKKILARLEAQGDGLTPRGHPAIPMSAGSMTDASKRLRGSSPSSDGFDGISGFSVVQEPDTIAAAASAELNQTPVTPQASRAVEFPPGVESLTQWGKTICVLPKVKKDAPTYSEIATWDSYEDYRHWVLKNGTTKGPVCLDLYNYLRACGCVAVTKGELFPGSNAVRKYRE